jgi:stage 0 sporulation protein B (sporulation initiation phosphotransferase)
MKKEALTVSQALKFARHDFLNHLQLVLMYIDLGKIPESKQAIRNASEEIKQLSLLDKFGLPVTAKWISTFGWVYTAFETKLSCTIEPGIHKVDDLEVASYLDALFNEVVDHLDEMSEYEAYIDVRASTFDWSINITISGPLNGKQQLPEAGKNFCVEETVSDNLWKFKISGN